jgi:hypothetical protein
MEADKFPFIFFSLFTDDVYDKIKCRFYSFNPFFKKQGFIFKEEEAE